MRKYTLISLFAGVSGSSLGFHNTKRITELLALDCDPYVEECFKLNFPKTLFSNKKIGLDIPPQEILKLINLNKGELDILFASPPCQGFSTARGKRNINDSRNDLFIETLKYIEEIQPKSFVIENVKGLVLGSMKVKFNSIITELEKLNYNYKYKVLNAVNYGVPQLRHRIIFIGYRNDLSLIPTFPNPILKVNMALGNYVENVNFFKGRQFAKTLYHRSKICRTITATPSMIFYNNGVKRNPTISEIKRLCSFPDTFKLSNANYFKQHKVIGNSVPPKMMETIANKVIETLDKNKEE